VVLADPAGGQLVHADDDEPRVSLRELAENVFGGIARPIVDNDDLESGIVLGEKGADRAPDARALVAGGNER
jgi:hypothetical protein